MLGKRILTGALLVGFVLAALFWAPRWLFFLLVLPFGLLAVWEYLELAARANTVPPRWPIYAVSLALWAVAAWQPAHLLPALIAGGLLLFVSAVWGSRGVADILPAAGVSIFALLVLAVPFALLFELRGGTNGQWIIFYLLLLVWVGDTAAYLGGRAVGRRRLAPRLSPGKTLEGTLASLVAAVAVGYWLFPRWFDFPSWHGLLLALIVNLAAQCGDLAESALKRSAGVKDSSALLPGHGGVLDRVDSLLFALPALWYYWKLLTRGGF